MTTQILNVGEDKSNVDNSNADNSIIEYEYVRVNNSFGTYEVKKQPKPKPIAKPKPKTNSLLHKKVIDSYFDPVEDEWILIVEGGYRVKESDFHNTNNNVDNSAERVRNIHYYGFSNEKRPSERANPINAIVLKENVCIVLSLEELDDDEMTGACAVCTDDFLCDDMSNNTFHKLSLCNHIFHKSCMDEMIDFNKKARKKSKCPLCRKLIKTV